MKKFARNACSLFLKLTLIMAAILASFVAMFASSGSIKESLADSKVYDNLIANVLDSATKEGDNEDQSQVPEDKRLSLDVLERSATQAFTPELVQSSAEQALDGVYRWLNGETAVPDFKIDLSQAKANFIAAAGQEVEAHVAGLPLCNNDQLRTISPDDDPLSLTCRPAYLTPAAAREKAVTELTNNEKFIPNPVLSANNLPKNENGKTVFEQAENVPKAYRVARALPWVLLGLSALFAAAVFFWSQTRRQGAKRLGTTFLGTGAFLFLTTWLFGFLFDRAARPGGPLSRPGENDGFHEPILAIVRALNKAFNQSIFIYSISYILLGTAILVALRFWWRGREEESNSKPAEPASAIEDNSEEEKEEHTTASNPKDIQKEKDS